MGLTIHYQLKSATRSANQLRRLMEQLRQRALDLPFKEVGEVVELSGDACDFNSCGGDNPLRWLLVQAGQYVVDGDSHYSVIPKHVIAFSTWPGNGCEAANFGLAVYPGTIDIRDYRLGRSRKLRTGLRGWCWSSFCKTQYASQHGVDHFLRCHLCVVKMLDHAKELGILAGVKDEGDFWLKRDIKALAQEVGEWNQDMAGLVGQMRDLFGNQIVAPIAKYPDFERLEARGQERLSKRRKG